MSELSTSENTLNVDLDVEPTTQPSNPVNTSNLTGSEQNITIQSSKSSYTSLEESKLDSLVSKAKVIPKVSYTLGKKVLSLDVETTGLNPWDYTTVVCSVWDLDEPKGDMKTFAGWDEEKLIKDLFDYIASKEPDVILAFNAKFECRCFITRAMLYHIQAPWLFTCEWHDMLAMLEGGWKNGLSGTMPSGSEENWLKFFFNEEKPYTIEECFEGIRNNDLDPMILRNRTCVQGQGDMYQLFMYIQSSEADQISEEKPSAFRIDEVKSTGMAIEKCEVCGAVNEIKLPFQGKQCWRCQADLPEPTATNIIKEQVRKVDWSKVGLSEKDSTKTTTTKKSSTTSKSSA